MNNLNDLQKKTTFNYGGNDRVKKIESYLEKGDFKNFWQEVRKNESFPEDFDKSISQETDGISFGVNEIEGEQLESLQKKVQFDTSNILYGKVSYIDEKSSPYIKMSINIGDKSEVILLTQEMFHKIKDYLLNEKSIKKFIIAGFPDVDMKGLEIGKLEGNGFDRNIKIEKQEKKLKKPKLELPKVKLPEFKEKLFGMKNEFNLRIKGILDYLNNTNTKQQEGVKKISDMIEPIKNKLGLDGSHKIKFYNDTYGRLWFKFNFNNSLFDNGLVEIGVGIDGRFLLYKNYDGLKNDGSYNEYNHGEWISDINIIEKALLEIAGEKEENEETIQENKINEITKIINEIDDSIIIDFVKIIDSENPFKGWYLCSFEFRNNKIDIKVNKSGSFRINISSFIFFDEHQNYEFKNTDVLKDTLNNLKYQEIKVREEDDEVQKDLQKDLQQEGVKKISDMIESIKAKLGLNDSQKIKLLDYNDPCGTLWGKLDFNGNSVEIGFAKDGEFLLFKDGYGLKNDGSYNDTNSGDWISDIDTIKKALLEIAGEKEEEPELGTIESFITNDNKLNEIKMDGPFPILHKINDNFLIIESLGRNESLVYKGKLIKEININGEIKQINLSGIELDYSNGILIIERKDGNKFKLEIELESYEEPKFENFTLNFKSKNSEIPEDWWSNYSESDLKGLVEKYGEIFGITLEVLKKVTDKNSINFLCNNIKLYLDHIEYDQNEEENKVLKKIKKKIKEWENK